MGCPAPLGVLLAAGRGRRMGGGKMLRRLPPPDGRPLVVAALSVLAGPCRHVIVVRSDESGPETNELEAVLRAATAGAGAATGTSLTFEPADPDAPMLASIRRGLARARAIDPRRPVLVHPGDVPGTAPDTVAAVLAAGREGTAAGSGSGDGPGGDGGGDGGADVAVMPEHDGRGGHPVLLPPAACDRVLALDDAHPGGLRAWWAAHPQWRLRLAVDDPGCRRDVDTPADLATLERDPRPDDACTS